MTKLKSIKLAMIGTAVAGLVVVASFLAAQADTTPPSVTCTGTPSGDTIAWTASASSGVPPYAYLWSGDQVAGNTSSSVTATYDATGTYDAMIQITDASSSIATSTCSATVTTLATSSTPTTDIGIAETVDNANPSVGDTINYTLTVSAIGSSTSSDVMAMDLLPAGLTFESATPSVGTYSSSTGDWTIGDMTPSSTATLAIATMVNVGTEGQTITNTANVSDDSGSTSSSSMAVVVQNAGGGTPTSTPTSTIPDAGLSIMKTVDNTTPGVGDMVNYTLTASALGPSTSTAAMVTDLLPTGLTFENSTSSMGTYASSTGDWTIGDMTPSSTATLTIEAMINPGTEDSVITNSAGISEASSVMNTSDQTSSFASLTVQSATSTTPTSTTPLSVACDWGYDADNVITWTSSVSGGTAPYTYLWSGDQIAGNTSSSVTATYPSTGAVFATVQITDADSNTGSASCSASITSVPSGGGGGTPTSTPPTPTSTSPSTLMIGQGGSFFGHGMQVISVASGSFQAEIWGITYTINWSGHIPRFYFRNDNNGSSTNPSDELAVGDMVDVSGKVTVSSPFVVNAITVRDDTITSPRHGYQYGGDNGNGGYGYGNQGSAGNSNVGGNGSSSNTGGGNTNGNGRSGRNSYNNEFSFSDNYSGNSRNGNNGGNGKNGNRGR